MGKNLIELFTDLSCELLKSSSSATVLLSKNERASYVKAVRKKAFDVIHQYHQSDEPSCVRSRVEWYPEIIIADYGYELMQQGADQAGALLLENLAILNEKEYKNLDGIWRLLLELKGSFLEENLAIEHPFSFSGTDYFFRPANPYEILPKQILRSQKKSPSKLSLKKDELALFLDLFVEKRKSSFVPTRKPTLDDFIESSPSEEKIKEEGKEMIENVKERARTPVAMRSQSSWSEIERQNLDGTEFLPELTPNEAKTKFVDDYLNSLGTLGEAAFKRKARPLVKLKQMKGLVLGIYQQDVALKQLMDSSYQTVLPHNVTLEYYVTQVKYLLCGVNSDLFKYDEDQKKFFMKMGTFVDGVTPNSLFELSKAFLETGTFFKNLKAGVEGGVGSSFGVLYPAFWNSVQEYLQRHNDAVAAIPLSSSLMALTLATSDLQAAIAAVHRLCFPKNVGLPSGGQLLSYLYDSCLAVQHQHVQKVIFSFLLDCTLVYISKLLEKWVFQGRLDSLWSADLFVKINLGSSSRRDRSCYLSVTPDEAHVPIFLQGLAAKIFACGKAIWLLHLFDPENKFIYLLEAMKHPRIGLCTSENEFTNLEHDFAVYEKVVVQLCGEKISFSQIREIEQKKDEKHEQKIKSKQIDAMKKAEVIKAIHCESRRKIIEEQDRMLKEQIEAIALKQEKRTEEKLKEQREDSELIRKENAKMWAIEEKKAEMKNHYQALAETAENIKRHAEWRTQRLQMHNRRVKYLKQDFLNDNTLLDEEGNIIAAEMDVENGNINSTVPLDNHGDHLRPIDTSLAIIEQAAAPGDERIKQKNLVSQISLNNSTIAVAEFLPARPITDAMKNKTKILGSFYFQAKSEVISKNKTTGAQNLKETDPKMMHEIAEDKTKVEPENLDKEDNATEIVLPSSPKTMTEADRNKKKILGTELGVHNKGTSDAKQFAPYCISEAERNKMKVLGTEYNIECAKKIERSISKPTLTDAMKIKMKVLGTEYGFADEKAPHSPSTGVLTDAVKNKLKMMSSSHEVEKKVCGQVGELTEAQRNKSKVLGTEYNLPPEDFVSLSQGPLSDYQRNRIRMHKTEPLEDLPEKPPAQRKNNLRIPEVKKKNSESGKFSETSLPELNEDITDETNAPSKPPRLPLISFYSLPSTFFNQDQLFPSILQDEEFETKPSLNELENTSFARYIQRSINIAVSVQMRLANAAVLKHFLLKENFMAHITSLRCYFFLHDGEFSRSLTNGLFQLLAASMEPYQLFDRSSLSGIVNEALIYSSHSPQTNAQNLSFEIWRMPSQLNPEAHDVLTPFQLSYKVSWPINIIITEACIEKYRKVFHVLVNLKRVHWTLNEIFLLLKTQTKDNALDGKRLMNSPEYTKLATYRHAMTLFIMTIEEHVCANGPQEAWASFVKQLESVSDLDHLYQKHVAFVKDVCRRCFLVKASQDLLSYINELIELGLRFHYILKSSTWRLINEKHYSHPQYSSLRSIFNRFCKTTKIFNKTLRKKTQHSEMKIHIPLLELIDLKIKV